MLRYFCSACRTASSANSDPIISPSTTFSDLHRRPIHLQTCSWARTVPTRAINKQFLGLASLPVFSLRPSCGKGISRRSHLCFCLGGLSIALEHDQALEEEINLATNSELCQSRRSCRRRLPGAYWGNYAFTEPKERSLYAKIKNRRND